MKGVLNDNINIKDIGGLCFVQENLIFLSLMKSSLTIDSKQIRAFVKEKSRFYISLRKKPSEETIYGCP